MACHKPNNLKDLVIPSRMKVCIERDLRPRNYVKNQVWNVLGVTVKDRVKDIALDGSLFSVMRESK